ncbi:MAG: DUF4276 family protein [Cyanobacteria bacterium J06621_8]
MINSYYHIMFLVEEPSMKAMLEGLLPNLIPDEIKYKCIAHEGKQDLEKSIPIKLRALKNIKRFIIIRDKDSADCKKVKQNLQQLCSQVNRSDTLIRIPCHELEAWYLGDLKAVEKGLGIKDGKLSKLQNKKKYREPDNLAAPKQELKKIASSYQQISGSKAISPHMSQYNNTSKSFTFFIEGINKVVKEIKRHEN